VAINQINDGGNHGRFPVVSKRRLRPVCFCTASRLEEKVSFKAESWGRAPNGCQERIKNGLTAQELRPLTGDEGDWAVPATCRSSYGHSQPLVSVLRAGAAQVQHRLAHAPVPIERYMTACSGQGHQQRSQSHGGAVWRVRYRAGQRAVAVSPRSNSATKAIRSTIRPMVWVSMGAPLRGLGPKAGPNRPQREGTAWTSR
jgi:hypothetical protein